MDSKHTDGLQRVSEIQKVIGDIHPFLEELFPVAVAKGGRLLIYDVGDEANRYAFVTDSAVPMPIPQGVRAAFPLECYNNRMACVVTDEIFNEPDGVVTIFHEFIHCRQAEVCEYAIKAKLTVAREAEANGDSMWEINHPFRYKSPDFERLYEAMLSEGTLRGIERIHRELKGVLPHRDYEYLVWQEWKEGVARFIENRIRRRLGFTENHNGRRRPFGRTVFYAGGAHYLQKLEAHNTSLSTNIERLFPRMFEGSGV